MFVRPYSRRRFGLSIKDERDGDVQLISSLTMCSIFIGKFSTFLFIYCLL